MSIVLVAQHRFDHPADAVFALSVDVERFPQTFTGYGPIPAIRRIVLQGPLAVGATREIHSSDGSVLSEHITALRPPLHHAYTLSGFRAPLGWLVRSGQADWQLQPLQNATLVTWSYRFETTGAIVRAPTALLLHRCMQPAMQRCLQRMNALLSGALPG
ncbi:MAG: SRPBCC family protein [Rhodanobacteraceae bacterium]|nr:SRPBCC family protein [Rhodanobacteraceae bacterium]